MRNLSALAVLALFVTLRPGVLPADESPAAGPDSAPALYYVEDIKEAMSTHLAAEMSEDGAFHLIDDRTGETLILEFIKIHDPVRQIDGETYFACTDFRLREAPKKVYDIDFWLHPVDGKLQVYDTKVHKEPRWSLLYGWYKYPRYTFVNDRVVSLY